MLATADLQSRTCRKLPLINPCKTHIGGCLSTPSAPILKDTARCTVVKPAALKLCTEPARSPAPNSKIWTWRGSGQGSSESVVVLQMNTGWWWLEHDFYFPIYWEYSSQLTFIFFRGVGQPPTRTNEQCDLNLSWLMIVVDYTTQYIGDYDKPIEVWPMICIC